MKRVQLEIVLGTIFVFLSAAILIYMAVGEQDRLARFEDTQRAEQIEFGAGIYESNCTSCHGDRAQGIPGKAPCLRCEEIFTTRLDDVGWEGSLEDYIISVVTTGRQVSTRPALYLGEGQGPPVMPTWSDKFGGPLRDDQIRAVAAFLVNFEPEALGQVPTPVPLLDISADSDDPVVRGRAAFIVEGCSGCHTLSLLGNNAVTGPVMDGLALRAEDTVEGLSAEEYLLESILNPGAFVVEGFNDGVMPQNFAEVLTEDEISDIIAFLLSLTEQ